MKWFGMKLMAGILLLCGISGVLAGFAAESANKIGLGQVQEPSETYSNQLEELYALATSQINSPLDVTVKLQAETLSGNNNEQAAKALAKGIGINHVTIEMENGEQAFRARDVISGINVRMDWVQAGERSYVKLQLDAQGTDVFSHLSAIQEKAELMMENAGITPAWNASVQGSVFNGKSAAETIQSVEEKMALHLRFNAVESYQDATTESRSYEVPSLKAYVMSGENPIHMQVAVHEDSMKNNNRITIGFPIISIEY